MQLVIDVPPQFEQRIFDWIGYVRLIPGPAGNPAPIQNPQTGAQAVKAALIKFLLDNSIAFEARRDAEAARNSAITKATSEIRIS